MLDAGQVRQFVADRKQQIADYLGHLSSLPSSITKEYQGYSQSLYYYSEQLQQYRSLLDHPDQLQQKGMDALNRLPAFQDFMKKNNQLSMLFGGAETGTAKAFTAGLQTRDEVQEMIKAKTGKTSVPSQDGHAASGGSQTSAGIVSQLDAAGLGLSAIQDRISRLGDAGKDM